MTRGSRPIVELGDVVREHRKGLGLSLNEAAKRSGIAKATLIRLERNERDSQLTTLQGLAQGLDLTFIIGPQGVFIEDGQA